jgi:hypothetical protein
VLDATLNVTVPFPVPLVRPVSKIHDAFELTLQSHDDSVVTEIELLFAPDTGTVTSLGEVVMLHVVGEVGGKTGKVGGGRRPATAASCVTFNVWPAMAIDAERVVVPAFDATVYVTPPGPVPAVPPVTTTQAASDRALQAQPVVAVTAIVPLPPAAETVCSVGESSKRQGAASWRIRPRSPFTTMSPCRAVPSGFAATCICSCALPCPDEGVRPVIQAASEEADQAHSGCVVKPTVAVSPPELTGEEGTARLTLHFAGEGPVEVATVEPQALAAQANAHRTT